MPSGSACRLIPVLDMDSTQSLESMDEDLQLLESISTPKTKTTAGNFASNAFEEDRVRTKHKIRETNLCAENVGAENVDCGESGDIKRLKSEVWNFFTRVGKINGVEKCQCKGCDKLYTCKPESGTTHLRRHLIKCYKSNSAIRDAGLLLDNQTALVSKWRFDSKAYRDALSRCIVRHDLPFSYAEYCGVNAINKILNPDFKPVSRNTASNDCMKVYLIEKDKLKSSLSTICGRICLTCDVWTAVTTQGYMSVTAHYVDQNWKLNSKLLSFCELDSPHTGLELSGKVLGVLKDWGIDSNVFSITLDNASNNDSLVKYLKERLNLQNGLLCEGEFFHVRCCAHILNRIVQDGLKVAERALTKIRGSVKYVKASEGRLKEFQKCIEEVHLGDVGGGFLRLDVSTRWNSTYMMLESAIKYRRAFTSLKYSDRNYELCPSDEEWERAQKLRVFLAPFYTITNLISGSSYPTSNLYFMQIASIELKLNEYAICEDEVIKQMALMMKVKFDKYWHDYCVGLAFGCVLDPKAKFPFLEYVYKRVYHGDCQEKVGKIKESLYKLFGEYQQIRVASSSSSPTFKGGLSHSQHSITSESPSILEPSILDEFHDEMNKKNSNEGKSELDVYLEEAVESNKDEDVLGFWKKNAYRFPRLAVMACDILSIPITTVASESTFSIGGRILSKYRNCLLPKNVQALICTRNWLHGFTEVDTGDQLVEEIELSKQDSNVLDDK